MSERGISSHNILEKRLRDKPKEHLSDLGRPKSGAPFLLILLLIK